MLAVRFVVLAALVLWLGGMAVLEFLVEPSIVRVMLGSDPVHGREVAGLLMATLLQQFHLLAYACGAIVIVGLFILKFVGPPPSAFVPRLGLVAAMLASAVYTGVPVPRELARIQAGVAGPVIGLPDEDPRRLRVEALQQQSSVLMSMNLGLGLLSLFWYARE